MSTVPVSKADYLARHSGVSPASPDALAELDAQSRAREQADRDASFTIEEVAACVGRDVSAVRELVVRGQLLAYPDGADGTLRVPDWQIADAGTFLPHLSDVLAAMPRPTPAVSARAFMTTPTTDMATDSARPASAVSPMEWLTAGGDPRTVLSLAGTLGEQI